MNVPHQSLRKLTSIAATATILATSIVSAAAPAIATAATTCVQEQGSTTVYPSLVQAQPGFQGAVTNPQPAWSTGQGLGCDANLVANGSGTGKTALINYYTGTGAVTDMAASSSPLNTTEAGSLLAFQVGGDGMVLVVNSTNPVGQISMAEVTSIYNNQLQNWSGLADASGKTGTILARNRIIGSGTRDDMNRLFKMDRGTGSGTTCSTGFTPSNCEPALVARLGLPRLTTSQDEAEAVCTSADAIAYTSLANLAAFGPGSAGCAGIPGAIGGSQMKALTLQGCTYTGYPGTAPVCSGSFVAPSTSTAAVGGAYPAKRQLFLTLPKISVAAAKFGTGNGTGWTDQLGLTKAMDIVNYMESTQGQAAMGAVNFITITVPAKQPIPDADIDLNGGIGLTDIGQITGRWNRVDSIKGSVRADVDNSGGVGLTDIGKITGQWGATGFVAP